MIKNSLYRYLLPAFIVLATGILAWWLIYNPVKTLKPSVPGMDERKTGAVAVQKVNIGETFAFFKTCDDIPGTRWPRFRGADFDNVSKENIRLIDKFPKEGPKILWKIPLGEGHAAPAVYDGRVYLLDYNETKKQDLLRCFSLATGEELWQRGYTVRLKRNHGLSRTIPAVTDKYVVTIGPRCQVMCVDRLKGDLLWGLDLAAEYNTEVPFWYTGQCPMVDNDTAIIATGGKSLMIAIDCKTGKKVWETPNPQNWKMSHSSVMPMIFKGKKMYVYCAVGGMCGVSAQGSDRGKLLWSTPVFSPSVIAPSPVILDNGLIYMTAGYGAGAVVIQIKESGGRFTAELKEKYKPNEGLASEQQTPVFYNGYLFGILPKDAGGLREQFACFKASDTRKSLMSSGKTTRFGLGPYILADNKFFILNDDGEMTIAKYSTSTFQVLDKAKILDGQDSWGPIAITGGYLLMRDSKTMVCLDVRAK
ncbi:MAG TPA: PQQ-binding-like beta-propeller repeat protein [Bacteroidales bacterium]|nr:PQQ-binding-like beta-propeller repeat protein [Bacteroidales bacterium]